MHEAHSIMSHHKRAYDSQLLSVSRWPTQINSELPCSPSSSKVLGWKACTHCSVRQCVTVPVHSFHKERFCLLMPAVLPLILIVILEVALCFEDPAEHICAPIWSSASETFKTKLHLSLEESSVSWKLCSNFSRKTYLPDTMGSYFSLTEI